MNIVELKKLRNKAQDKIRGILSGLNEATNCKLTVSISSPDSLNEHDQSYLVDIELKI